MEFLGESTGDPLRIDVLSWITSQGKVEEVLWGWDGAWYESGKKVKKKRVLLVKGSTGGKRLTAKSDAWKR